MARKSNGLTAVQVRQSPAGKYADGGGLWCVKSDKSTGKWVLRVVVHGRRREMGLGSIADVGLKEAREAADKWRAVVRDGGDPIKERERQRRERERNQHLLKDVAHAAFEARKASLKGDGESGRWFSPLELHVLPRLGNVPVSEIDQRDIRDTLAPIWRNKAATAEKALQRLLIVLAYAKAEGHDVDLEGCKLARELLGEQGREVEHIPSMPWQDVPTFYAGLSDGSVTHLALRLLILTGVRSTPLRQMREDQVAGDVWIIPAGLMKSRKGKAVDFHVPLSPEAKAVIDQARRHARGGWLFPRVGAGGRKPKSGIKKERPPVISDGTLSNYMTDAGIEARPHGFRSSLRTFLSELKSGKPAYEVAEMCIAHDTRTKTQKAYDRTGWLDERRALMDRWAGFVTGKHADAGNVVPLAWASA